MIVTILKVGLIDAGFAVTYHKLNTDIMGTAILKPTAMPSGHELIRTGETVDLVFDGSTVVSVCACGRSRMFVSPSYLAPHVA